MKTIFDFSKRKEVNISLVGVSGEATEFSFILTAAKLDELKDIQDSYEKKMLKSLKLKNVKMDKKGEVDLSNQTIDTDTIFDLQSEIAANEAIAISLLGESNYKLALDLCGGAKKSFLSMLMNELDRHIAFFNEAEEDKEQDESEGLE